MIHEYLFRGKVRIDDSWVVGYYDGNNIVSGNVSYNVLPDTISPYIGADCYEVVKKNNQEDYVRGEKIFINDIVRITLFSGRYYDYLLWHSHEIPTYNAIPIEETYFNGVDYYSSIKNDSWENFMFLVNDPWGDVKSVQVIGNYFENKDLLKE